MLNEVDFHIPEVATKQLKVQTVQDKRRVTLSSNLLLLAGFEGNVSQVIEESLGEGQGFIVRLASQEEIAEGKTKKVYTREYKSRSANPLKRKEHLIQISRQDLIDNALGKSCTHVHVTLRYGEIIFKPIKQEQFDLIQDIDSETPINTFVAMTGGVDCHVLEKSGFAISAVVEYRPQEARDNTDYTELTSMSVLANCKPNVLFNEDIYTLDVQRIAEVLVDTPITFSMFSLQCDDFSTLKTHQQRENSVADLSSTLDMFIPMLNIIDKLKNPVVLIENVPGFQDSPINDVVRLQLMRRGFTVHQDVFDARDYGGHTSRKRTYLVATTLKAPFEFPEKTAPAPHVWPAVIEPNWDEIVKKDVTDTKVAKDSITTNRLRAITEDKHFAPTLTKSQGQDAKDSVVVQKDGRIYRLPVRVQKLLNGISDSFNLDWMPVDKAAQVIGQSICCNLHEAIIGSVKKHIQLSAKLATA
jgi:DNA (cytosine-5)-methyltransferase 1